MMDPMVFGRQLELLMDGHADDPFWLTHIGELTQCQLGALYVAMRLGERKRQERSEGSDAMDRVLATLVLSQSWTTKGCS